MAREICITIRDVYDDDDKDMTPQNDDDEIFTFH